MIFDGNPKRGRRVNLSGSRQTSSRNDVLRNAEQQRLRRDQLRREQAAAQTLQAAWRGNEAKKEVLHALAEEYLDAKAYNQPPEVVGAAFSMFLPVLLPPKTEADDKRLASMLGQLLKLGPIHGTRLAIPLVKILDVFNYQYGVLERSREVALKLLDVTDIKKQWVGPFALNLLPSYDKSRNKLLRRLCEINPEAFMASVLQQDRYTIRALDTKILEPAFSTSVSREPRLLAVDGPETIEEVVKVLAPHASRAWKLIGSLLENAIPPEMEYKPADFQGLYSREVVASFPQAGTEFADYFLRVLAFLPDDRSEILLQLELPSSPSLIQRLWLEFADTDLCATCLQGPEALVAAVKPADLDKCSLLALLVPIYSYWLLIATDDSFLFGSDRTLQRPDLDKLALVLRNVCFTILWHWDKNKDAQKMAMRDDLFALLRQIYTRDSRRKFLPPQFWLMESFMAEFMATAVSDEALEESEDEDIKVVPKSRSLEVLRQAPFFVDFTTRANLLRKFIDTDSAMYPSPGRLAMLEFGRQHFPMNRESLLEDAQAAFATLGSRIKNDLAVQFLSEGVPESGIDGGGLTKELLTGICTDVFKTHSDPRYSSLFIETPNHTLYPAPKFSERSRADDSVRRRYVFLGQVIAKCLYENILVDVEFAPFFLAKWAGESGVRSSFDDLFLLDEDLYSSLVKLNSYKHVESLELDFTTVGPEGQTVLLRPNGDQIAVTDANKLEYIRQLANYKLNVSLWPQTRWFLEGMSSVISLNWLKMFNPHEIQCLISGRSRDVDVDDLKRNTEIFGFPSGSQTISNLWHVLKEDLTPEQRGEFLKFVTSVPRAPLLGFQQLEPHFGIRCAGYDDQRLPTSSTCVNLLKLPEYSSRSVLKQKLLYAIESKAGFDLS